MNKFAKGGALAASIGLGIGLTTPAAAVSLVAKLEFKGAIALLNPDGQFIRNQTLRNEPPWFGYRSPVEGMMELRINVLEGVLGGDLITGTAEIEPFVFLGQPTSAENIHFESTQLIPGLPIPSTQLIGNLSFNFGTSADGQGIPVNLVLEVAGLTEALRSAEPGDRFKGLLRGASENTVAFDGNTYPVGPSIVVTTTWNTTDVDTDGDGQPGPIMSGDNPSGTLPLIEDTRMDATNGDIGIAGSPMKAGPFPNHNAAFDFYELKVVD